MTRERHALAAWVGQFMWSWLVMVLHHGADQAHRARSSDGLAFRESGTARSSMSAQR